MLPIYQYKLTIDDPRLIMTVLNKKKRKTLESEWSMSNQQNVSVRRNTSDSKIRDLVITALMAAVICVLAPISLPIGPVPVSLSTLAIYFVVYIVGTRRAFTAVLVYILLGMAGLPVFSGWSGGVQKMAGPTGGYIVGYLPMVIVMGLYIDRHRKNRIGCILVSAAATAVLYVVGTVWFLQVMTDTTLAAALSMCVLPFIPGDLAKIIIAAIFSPMIRGRLQQANLL